MALQQPVANTVNRSVVLGPLSANSSTFVLMGGLYGLAAIAGSWSSGSATLQRLGPDASTWVTAATAFSANGYETAFLPAGTYRLAVATATGVYFEATLIPQPAS